MRAHAGGLVGAQSVGFAAAEDVLEHSHEVVDRSPELQIVVHVERKLSRYFLDDPVTAVRL